MKGEFEKRITEISLTPLLSQEILTEKFNEVIKDLGRELRDPTTGEYFYDRETKQLYYYGYGKWLECTKQTKDALDFLELVDEARKDFPSPLKQYGFLNADDIVETLKPWYKQYCEAYDKWFGDENK